MRKKKMMIGGTLAVILGLAASAPAFAVMPKMNGEIRAKYGSVIKQYEEKYGKPSLEAREYANVMTGLCFTRLVDFDQNGLQELLLVYNNEADNNEFHPVGSYAYEVWSCADGGLKMLEKDSLYGGDGGSQTLPLTEYLGKWYLISGSADGFEYDYYHGFGPDGFGVVHTALMDEQYGEYENYEDSLSCTLDGREVSGEEWQADVGAWRENAEYYRMNYQASAKIFLEACRQTKEALGMDTSGMDLTDGDYIFPGSDMRYIFEDNLKDLSDWELMLARNEIFARHGRKFSTPELQQHFASKAWYAPIYSPEEFEPIQYDVMSEIEWDNINLISEVEAARAESAAAAQEASDNAPIAEENVRELMAGEYGFSSGVGAWGTGLELVADGTFTGQYHDSEMGSTGDGYPNGSVYICDFHGKFTEPQKISDYVYSMRLESLETGGVADESYIEDGVRYIYSEPYGLEDAEEFYVYLPGTPMSDMEDGFLMWLFLDDSLTALPSNYYGIYNVNAQHGFVSIR